MYYGELENRELLKNFSPGDKIYYKFRNEHSGSVLPELGIAFVKKRVNISYCLMYKQLLACTIEVNKIITVS